MRTNSISLCSCKTQYNIKKAWILALLTGFMVAACHPKPHNVRQAGRDALESARIQLDSGNKAEALPLFKDAEHYSLLANDTLTVAYARYNIARCLGYYADKQETVSLLRSAAEGFSDDYANRAEALRELGDFYQIHSQFDSAEYYLEQAIVYAEQSGSTKAKRDVLSAFHTMYFNAGDYESRPTTSASFGKPRLQTQTTIC